MTTKQISETQLACRRYDPVEDLSLTLAPNAAEESDVQTTKLKAGCEGRVLVMGIAAASGCTVKLKAEADDTLNFGADTTDIVVDDTVGGWGEIQVNGDTLRYWGMEVTPDDANFEWDKLIVLETSEISIEDGENYTVCTAAFNAKHVEGTGDWSSDFPV